MNPGFFFLSFSFMLSCNTGSIKKETNNTVIHGCSKMHMYRCKSILRLYLHILYRVAVGMEVIPAGGREAGFSPHSSPVDHMADTQRPFTLTFTPTGDLDCQLTRPACSWTVGGSWSMWRKPTEAWREQANSKLC